MKLGMRRGCGLNPLRSWVAVCVFLAVVLLLCHDPLLIIWWPQRPAEKTKTEGLPLDMATDSIDDMYDGCRSEAAAMIDLFGVFEWHFNRDFSFSWALAEEGAKKPRHKFLKEEHAIVIYIYTKMKHIQQDFNKAVKTGKHKYSTYRFRYHYFYFHLTDAIQFLKQNQPLCRTTYHRTQIRFNRNVVDRKMRFGAFTLAASTKSSFSFKGNVSCFEIYTCFGADVTYYSAINQMGQVLIPPYEVFHITDNSGESGLKGQVPLDLAPNAVDDMYTGCKDKMDNRVKKQYLPNEKNKDKNFTLAWGEAERYYNKKWKRRKGKRPSTSLGKEQIMAIYVYTLDKPNVYLDFNTAVRTKRSVYVTAFKYHTLHFFLTDALQTLSSRKPEGERCVTGYRRVNSSFRQDVLNKEIRFGSFTSSSMGDYPRPDRFGNKSCFEIFTCFGADISLYSKVGESEREVLIPPYEVFKVTKVERRSDHQSLPCEVVYKVKSTRTLSKLNCALF
ncbi:hypothetical protein INR49_026401 [Caranx melampygus]|nr:hypothetical protein INR49_026401 [Caranx melampygus]